MKFVYQLIIRRYDNLRHLRLEYAAIKLWYPQNLRRKAFQSLLRNPELNHHRLEAGGFGLAAESSLKLTNLEVIALLSFF